VQQSGEKASLFVVTNYLFHFVSLQLRTCNQQQTAETIVAIKNNRMLKTKIQNVESQVAGKKQRKPNRRKTFAKRLFRKGGKNCQTRQAPPRDHHGRIDRMGFDFQDEFEYQQQRHQQYQQRRVSTAESVSTAASRVSTAASGEELAQQSGGRR
jgi:hypothetical protein